MQMPYCQDWPWYEWKMHSFCRQTGSAQIENFDNYRYATFRAMPMPLLATHRQSNFPVLNLLPSIRRSTEEMLLKKTMYGKRIERPL